MYRGAGTANYYDALEIQDVSSGYGKLLLMKSGGNVGIGTTKPYYKNLELTEGRTPL